MSCFISFFKTEQGVDVPYTYRNVQYATTKLATDQFGSVGKFANFS